jgi:hypothetical protein
VRAISFEPPASEPRTVVYRRHGGLAEQAYRRISCEWPKTEYVHWQKLHEAANEARQGVSKFYMLADEIDRNADFSHDGKYRQRSKAADEAMADFEASKTLVRAREAVELALAKRNSEQHVSPEIAQDSEAMLKAMKEAEHGWQRAIDKIAERAGLTKRLDTRR